jgi:hypothetical protein
LRSLRIPITSAVGPGAFDDLGQVLAEAVVGHAAVDVDAQVGHVGELEGVVRLDEDRLGQVLADLVAVDVEGRHELDVADVVAAQVDVHEAGMKSVVLRVGVVVAALDQAAGAVADADDGDADLAVAGPMAVRSAPLPLVRATMLSSPCCRVRQPG